MPGGSADFGVFRDDGRETKTIFATNRSSWREPAIRLTGTLRAFPTGLDQFDLNEWGVVWISRCPAGRVQRLSSPFFLSLCSKVLNYFFAYRSITYLPNRLPLTHSMRETRA